MFPRILGCVDELGPDRRCVTVSRSVRSSGRSPVHTHSSASPWRKHSVELGGPEIKTYNLLTSSVTELRLFLFIKLK